MTISVQESLTHSILKHRLGEDRYIQLDDVLTPDRAKSVSLDKTDASAREVLIGSGKERAKLALGDGRVQSILNHNASPPRFYYGERANSETGGSHA